MTDVNTIASGLDASYKILKDSLSYVYFQPQDVGQIKDTDSKQCFTKSEYAKDQQNPMIQIPGLHTRESCKMNAEKQLANNKWTNNFVPSNSANNNKSSLKTSINKVTKTPGLNYKVIQSYFNDNVQLFNTAPVLNSGRATDFGSISGATNNYIRKPHGDQHDYSVEWTGFFIPDKTGSWTFGLNSDDASYLWIGNDATNSYTSSNALVNNRDLHGMKYITNQITLIKGRQYPIRMQFGERGGGHDFILNITEENGTQRTDYSKLLFTLTTKTEDQTVEVNNFSMNSNFFYSMTALNPEDPNKKLFNCYVNDPTSTARSGDNNYDFQEIWSSKQTTAAGNAMANPGTYSGILSYNNGKLTFNQNGNLTDYGSSTGIIVLDDDGILYTQDIKGNYRVVSKTTSNIGLPIENADWANYKYVNNITSTVDLSTVGNITKPNHPILISDNSKFKLEINEFGNLVIKQTIKGCVTKTATDEKNKDFNYTTNNNSAYYLYGIDADKKSDKLFFQKGNELQYIDKSNTAVLPDNSYFKYEKFAPIPSDMANEKQTDDCQKNCNNDPTCKYFYQYKKNDGKNYCLNRSDDYLPKTWTPIQPNSSIETSSLNIRNLKMDLNPNDFRKMIEKKNVPGSDYSAYSNYTVSTADFKKDDINGGIPCELLKPMITQYKYYNGTSDNDPLLANATKKCSTEGFEDHGYQNQDTVYTTYGTGIPKPIGLLDAIDQQQITPIRAIAADYSNKLNNVNTNYSNLSGQIDKMNNTIKDLSGNPTYDYNTPFELNKKNTVVDGRISDTRELLIQQNSLYVLGTITAASLLVFGIVMARE